MKSLLLISALAIFLCACGMTDATKRQAWVEGAAKERITVATPPGTIASFEITKPDGTTIKATIDDKTVPWYKSLFGWIASKPNYTVSN